MIDAKLDGNYVDVLNSMKQNHIVKGIKTNNGDDLIVMNSFYGAEAFETQTYVESIVLFHRC